MKKILLFLACLGLFCTLGFAQTAADQNTPTTDNTKATKAERDGENQADTQSARTIRLPSVQPPQPRS